MSVLARYKNSHSVIIDLTVFLHPKFQLFLNELRALYAKDKKLVFVDTRIIAELAKRDETKALKLILDCKEQKELIKLEVPENLVKKPCIIHQDKGIARGLLKKGIAVLMLNEEGRLCEFKYSKKPAAQSSPPSGPVFKANASFIPDTKAAFHSSSFKEPQLGDTLYTQSKQAIKLVPAKNGKALGAGGEACVYETNTPYIAKIYKKEKLSKRSFEKLKLMVAKKASFQSQAWLCWPVELLFDKKGEFVGYLMPRARGANLGESTRSKKRIEQYYPRWKKSDFVYLARNILYCVDFLHSHNIIIGDLNRENIMVKSQDELYFVDTDSYQIEGFPCPVGKDDFVAPQLQGRDFGSFLRKKEDDNFALSVLLFMIMLPNIHPYSKKGATDRRANIKNGEFAYPFKGFSRGGVPEGDAKYQWAHLGEYLQENFIHSFDKQGYYFQPQKRLGADKWLIIFNNYLKALQDGSVASKDPMSLEVYPARFPLFLQGSVQKCKNCGCEELGISMKDELCKSCSLKAAKSTQKSYQSQYQDDDDYDDDDYDDDSVDFVAIGGVIGGIFGGPTGAFIGEAIGKAIKNR